MDGLRADLPPGNTLKHQRMTQPRALVRLVGSFVPGCKAPQALLLQ